MMRFHVGMSVAKVEAELGSDSRTSTREGSLGGTVTRTDSYMILYIEGSISRASVSRLKLLASSV